jgi:hypothetical protein
MSLVERTSGAGCITAHPKHFDGSPAEFSEWQKSSKNGQALVQNASARQSETDKARVEREKKRMEWKAKWEEAHNNGPDLLSEYFSIDGLTFQKVTNEKGEVLTCVLSLPDPRSTNMPEIVRTPRASGQGLRVFVEPASYKAVIDHGETISDLFTLPPEYKMKITSFSRSGTACHVELIKV